MRTEAQILSLIKANPNMAVPYYLCGAYTYYGLDDPFISDGTWEWLAKFLQENWDQIEHRHKHLITADMLASGSFFMPEGRDYPEIVKDAVRDLQGPRKRRR